MSVQTSSSDFINVLDTKILFDLCSGKFSLDIASSLFEAGGEDHILGVKFKIVDPYGVTIKDYPSSGYDKSGVDLLTPFMVNIPTEVGTYQYGIYVISALIKDDSDNEFEEVKNINIKEPVNSNGGKYGVIKALISANLKDDKVYISVSTPPPYSLEVDFFRDYDLSLEYPTSSELSNSNVGVSNFSARLFEGVYKLSGSVCVSYNLGDNVFASVKYNVDERKEVFLSLDYFCIFDNLSKLSLGWENDSDQDKEKHSSDALRALLLIQTATLAASNGKDPSEFVEQLNDLLGDDCGGDGADNATPLLDASDPSQLLISGGGYGYASDYFDDDTDVIKTGKAFVIGNDVYGLLDEYGSLVTYKKVSVKQDGVTPYSDSDIDGVFVRKRGDQFFIRNVAPLLAQLNPAYPMANVDKRFGVYNSIAEAKAATAATKKQGLTVGILEDGKVVEYVYKNNTTDLVIKIDQVFTAAEKAQLATNTTDIASISLGAANATPATVINPAINIYNIASSGTYSNLGGVVIDNTDLAAGLVQIRKINGTWTKVITPINLLAYATKIYADENAEKAKVNEVALVKGYVEFALSITNGGAVTATTGAITANADYQYSGFIKVTPSQVIYFTGTLGGVAGITGYDANRSNPQAVFSLLIDNPSNPVTRRAYYERPITIPAGVFYIVACSAYRNPSNVAYIGGMTNLSITDRPKVLAIPTVIDSNLELIEKTYGKPTDILVRANALINTVYADAVGGFTTVANRAALGLQPVKPNRTYTVNYVSQFGVVLDANSVPLMFWLTSGVASDNFAHLGIPRVDVVAGVNYDLASMTLTFKTPVGAVYFTANNGGGSIITSTAALTSWKNSVSLVEIQKSSSLTQDIMPLETKSVQSAVKGMLRASTNYANQSLASRGFVWNSATKGLTVSTNRGVSGFQPVPPNTKLILGRASHLAIIYDNVGTIVKYYASVGSTVIPDMGSLPLTYIVDGTTPDVDGNYDLVTNELTIITPNSAATVIFNDPNRTGWQLTSDDNFNIWAQAIKIYIPKLGNKIAATYFPFGLRSNQVNGTWRAWNHRSLHGEGTIAPENTRAAATLSARIYDGIECDVQWTSDGEPVVHHDDSINRMMVNASDLSTIGSTVLIANTTLSDLKTLYVIKTSTSRFRETIPTFKEFCLHCKKLGVKMMIEPKKGAMTLAQATQFIQIIRDTIGIENVVLYTGDPSRAVMLRELDEGVALCLSNVTVGTPLFDLAASIGNCAIMIGWVGITADVSLQCSSRGIDFWVATPLEHELNDILNTNARFVLSDWIIPPVEACRGRIIQLLNSGNLFTGFTHNGSLSQGVLSLTTAQSVTSTPQPLTELDGYWIEAEIKGAFIITTSTGSGAVGSLSGNNSEFKRVIINRHLYNKTGNFSASITASSGTIQVKELKVTVKEF